MPKCKICMVRGEDVRFDTEGELHSHLDDAHPKPESWTCPEGMEDVQELLIEALFPKHVIEGRSHPDPKIRDCNAQIEEVLRKWNIETVNHLLTVLSDEDYQITKGS